MPTRQDTMMSPPIEDLLDRGGFEHDTNAVTLLSADGAVRDVPLTGKRDVARELFDVIPERRSKP